MSGSGSGIGGDIMGGLQLLGGGIATILGAPQIGIPLMVGGGNSIVGGNLGGGSGGSSGGIGFASPFTSGSGGPPPISMGPASQGQQLANLGGAGFPGAAGMSGLSSIAPPPASITPNLSGGTANPLSGNLNPNLTGAVQPSNTGLALQDAGGVGAAYQNYLLQSQKLKYQPTYVGGHSSQVVAPQLNPFAPNQSSPINPPVLRV